MILIDLTKILSVVFTGVSVFTAIYIYHKNSEKEYFREFRKSLVSYRNLLEEARELFDDVGLAEIGYSIALQLQSLYPEEGSLKEIRDFITDEKNANLTNQAFYLGIGKSKTIEKSKLIVRSLQQIHTAHRESFPLTNRTFGLLNAYDKAMINTFHSIDIISDIILALGQDDLELDNRKHKDLVFRELGFYIAMYYGSAMTHLDDNLFEHSNNIAGVLGRTYEKMSDRELRKTSNLEKKKSEKFSQNALSKDAPKALFEFLKFYKPLVNGDDWDLIVESKTKVESTITTEEE